MPDTGQTLCYDDVWNVITCPSPGQPFYRQDGNYSINPMSYTKLDGNGNAVPDNAPFWVMVRDNVTGLIWEVKTNMDRIKNYNDPHDADNTYAWYDSNLATNGGMAGCDPNISYYSQSCKQNTESFLNSLNNGHFGGYTDWRLPTFNEVVYLRYYNKAYPEPIIDTRYFPNTKSYAPNSNIVYYFSSTTCTGTQDNNFVWIGTFASEVYSAGLMWQKSKPQTTMSLLDALSYCDNLNLGGYSDWRLPTVNELLSIVDYNLVNPAVNTKYFLLSGIDYDFWTSTTQLPDSISNVREMRVTLSSAGISYGGGGTKGDYCNVIAVRGGQASTQTACPVAINTNFALNLPYLSYNNGQVVFSTDFLYDYNPSYSSLIIFKLSNESVLNNQSFSCTPSSITGDLSIHIPDLDLPDGTTHLWVDLTYNPALSTDGNFYWVVTNAGVIS